MAERTEVVVFDLGGVLIDWDRRYLYEKLIPEEARRETFLSEVCDLKWNARMDRGVPFASAIKARQEKFPEWSAEIEAYFDRWEEMLGEAIDGTVEILAELDARGVPLFSLTNWSAETFSFALDRFEFLQRFQDILVSGELRMAKPEMSFYMALIEKHGLEPKTTLFIDDREKNVQGARLAGMQAVTFTSPEALRSDLVERELLLPS